jgi:ACS family hexuronate transporter-like MFS transporter
VTGIGGFAGSVGGILVAIFAGYVLEITKDAGHVETGYTTLFIIAGSAYLVAWVLFNLIAPGMKKVDLK